MLDGLMQLIDDIVDSLIEIYFYRDKKWIWCKFVILLTVIAIVAFIVWWLVF